MKKTFILLTTLLILGISSCKKDKITDPNTQPNADCTDFSVSIETLGDYFLDAEVSTGRYSSTYLWNTGETTSLSGTDGVELDYGTYSVIVTNNESKCKDTAYFEVTEPVIEIETEIRCLSNSVISLTTETENVGIVTERGICYAVNTMPTIGDIVLTNSSPLSNDNYYTTINSLSNSTTYYVRGYVIDNNGTHYGNEIVATTNSSAPALSVGQYHQGGLIFSMDCDGQHGKIVADTELFGGGSYSTAEGLCENLVHSGYDDWKLPTQYDLQNIQNTLYNNNLGNFSTNSSLYESYWSDVYIYSGTSSACSDYTTLAHNMNTGTQHQLDACYQVNVRPIREF